MRHHLPELAEAIALIKLPPIEPALRRAVAHFGHRITT